MGQVENRELAEHRLSVAFRRLNAGLGVDSNTYSHMVTNDEWIETPTGHSEGLDPNSGATVWFTGLSSSGKTSISSLLYEMLKDSGRKVELLDGDVIRQTISKGLGFSRQDRDENIRRIGAVARELTQNGIIVLVAAISPYRAVRDELRQGICNFIEVYVDAPLALCEKRDVKGLYRKARKGEISHFTGIDDPYEPPLNPEVWCCTDRETVEESAGKVYEYLKRLKVVMWHRE